MLTTWIVGKTNRFKAAAAQKPVINWISEALTMDNTGFTSRYWFAKQPWEDPMSYWSRSPLSLVGNISTPTLVVVGSEDYRTPVERERAAVCRAADPRRADRAGQGARRQPRRLHRAAEPVGGEGVGDPGVVRPLSHGAPRAPASPAPIERTRLTRR